MALDAYMAFIPGDGDPKIRIEGESSDAIEGVKKAFEIISFKWGASAVVKTSSHTSTTTGKDNSGKTSSGTSAPSIGASNLSARSISVDGFSISKPFDTASTSMFQACVTEGCKFAKAQVYFRKYDSSGKPYVYLTFQFMKVRIDKIDWKLQAIEGGDKPDEEDVDFSFETCMIFYSPQSHAGDKASDVKKTASYSRPANKIVEE